MTTYIQSSTLCYATPSDFVAAFPDASGLTTPQQTALLTRAQSMVDALVGFHSRRNCPCEGQTTTFPRSCDCCPTTFLGAFDPAANPALPCPAKPWSWWNITSNAVVGGINLIAGQVLVATKAVQSCPADPSAFVTAATVPDAQVCFIPWQIHRATLVLAWLMYIEGVAAGTYSSSSGSGSGGGMGGSGTGLIGCLEPGDKVKLDDFEYSRGTGCGCAAAYASGSISATQAALSTDPLGREVLSLLGDFSNFSFGIC